MPISKDFYATRKKRPLFDIMEGLVGIVMSCTAVQIFLQSDRKLSYYLVNFSIFLIFSLGLILIYCAVRPYLRRS